MNWLIPLVSFAFTPPALVQTAAQGATVSAPAPVDDRFQALQRENAELARRIDVIADELSAMRSNAVAPTPAEGRFGVGPAASKVYASRSGVSIGGYGEFLYENQAGEAQAAELDLLRAVLYFGYRFDEHFVFNSEIEYEHAGEEVHVEFAYLDYLCEPEVNFRAGLVLVPMGLTNELHEPTTFFSAQRPLTERLILPTTWAENGVGVFGDAGDFAYRAFVVNGFDAAGFTAQGLRGGRQQGSEALAEDFAIVARGDYTGMPGLLAGVSAYWGEAGQTQQTAGGESIDAATTLAEAHVQYEARGWRLRALAALGEVDDVADLNDALGLVGTDSIGEELRGGYVEVGYDVLSALAPESAQSVTPFVRWETIDTQADVPAGFAVDSANDFDVSTFGVAYQPIEHVVIKADYRDFDDDASAGKDGVSVLLGFIF